jgi:hypothetical protein
VVRKEPGWWTPYRKDLIAMFECKVGEGEREKAREKKRGKNVVFEGLSASSKTRRSVKISSNSPSPFIVFELCVACEVGGAKCNDFVCYLLFSNSPLILLK